MIQVVSAYLLKQKGYVDDPQDAHNKIKNKSWFKQIMADYPTTFKEQEGVSVIGAGGAGGLVTRVGNIYQGEYTSRWDYYIMEIEDYSPNVGAWILDVSSDDYISPGSLHTFENMSYYQYRVASSVGGLNSILKKIDINGSITTQGIRLQEFAKKGDSDLEPSGVPEAFSENVAYPISIDIKLPIFRRIADGEAYANAAATYQNNPTQANYDAVCAYIDICLNPDG